MKFIYCSNPRVIKDLEEFGLKKIGNTIINGKETIVFANNKTTYLNAYAKNEIFLSNQLLFDVNRTDK